MEYYTFFSVLNSFISRIFTKWYNIQFNQYKKLAKDLDLSYSRSPGNSITPLPLNNYLFTAEGCWVNFSNFNSLLKFEHNKKYMNETNLIHLKPFVYTNLSAFNKKLKNGWAILGTLTSNKIFIMTCFNSFT